MDVYFGKSYDMKDLFLMEVPSNYLEDIKASRNNLKLKGNDNYTVITTDSKSYELKYVYTTNSFYLLDKNNNEDKLTVSLVSDHTLELTDYLPKRSQVYKMLRSNCLKYNKFNGASNYNNLKKLTFEDYLNCTDMNRQYLCQVYLIFILQTLENFNALEKNGYIFLFDEEFSLNITRDILYSIVQDKLDVNNINVPYIFEKLSEKYPELYLSDGDRKCLINGICDIQNDRISMNIIKTKILCVKSIFCSQNIDKRNMYVREFTHLLNQTFRLVFPTEIMDTIIEEEIKYQITGCQDNLFEYYSEFDLRFLKGNYTMSMLGSQKEPIIINVDTHSLSEKFEMRLNELFHIKDRWLTSELKYFLQIEYNFNKEEKLQKYCKIISDVNPFDSKKTITYYMLKNKIPI